MVEWLHGKIGTFVAFPKVNLLIVIKLRFNNVLWLGCVEPV